MTHETVIDLKIGKLVMTSEGLCAVSDHHGSRDTNIIILDPEDLSVLAQSVLNRLYDHERIFGSSDCPYLIIGGAVRFFDLQKRKLLREMPLSELESPKDDVGRTVIPIGHDGRTLLLKTRNTGDFESKVQRFEFESGQFEMVQAYPVDAIGNSDLAWVSEGRSVEQITQAIEKLESGNVSSKLLGFLNGTETILASDNETQLVVMNSELEIEHRLNPFNFSSESEKNMPGAERRSDTRFVSIQYLRVIVPPESNDTFLLVYDDEAEPSRNRLILVRKVDREQN